MMNRGENGLKRGENIRKKKIPKKLRVIKKIQKYLSLISQTFPLLEKKKTKCLVSLLHKFKIANYQMKQILLSKSPKTNTPPGIALMISWDHLENTVTIKIIWWYIYSYVFDEFIFVYIPTICVLLNSLPRNCFTLILHFFTATSKSVITEITFTVTDISNKIKQYYDIIKTFKVLIIFEKKQFSTTNILIQNKSCNISMQQWAQMELFLSIFLKKQRNIYTGLNNTTYKSTDKSNQLTTTTFLVTPTVIPRMPGIINYNRN